MSLQTLVHICLFHRVRPILSHVAGQLNVLADAITRFRDPQKALIVARLPVARRCILFPQIPDAASVLAALQPVDMTMPDAEPISFQ